MSWMGVACQLFADIALERMKVRRPRARLLEEDGRERALGPENRPCEAKPLKEGTSLMIV